MRVAPLTFVDLARLVTYHIKFLNVEEPAARGELLAYQQYIPLRS